MMHTSPRRSFTLVEILTVVGILALLVAILLPALRTARRNAEWADAANNLRQVSPYLQAYITDNRESIAPTQFAHRGQGAEASAQHGDARGCEGRVHAVA